MRILAIDTSCDDTSLAIVEAKKLGWGIKSNFISSQVEIHQKYGGVYPLLAKREHERNLPILLKKALKETTLSISKIDLIAVTNGPGLEPCLWVGVNFAKKLSRKWNLPLVPVNHIESHILANWIVSLPKNIFPAICLVVSGGHTQLILMKDFGKYKLIGETRDDAAGECFDKTARILGLSYPGGPAIAKLAREEPAQTLREKIELPRPMINSKDYDFSFSGLKTAVLYHWRSEPREIRESKEYIEEMAREIQEAVIDVLIKKTIKGAKDYKAKAIILGGGVAANEELRKQFRSKVKSLLPKVKFFVPPKSLCTDNAVMTAIAGYFNRQKKTKNIEKIKAEANLKINN